MKDNHTPPQQALRFFRWYCHPKLVHYIEGDLMELYQERVKDKGKRSADIQFIIDVILLLRPAIIRPAKDQEQLNNHIMFKSYFKIGWRSLIRNKSYSFINIAGLALSMTCGILLFTFVKHHLGFDNFHANSDRIYRIVTEQHRDVVGYTSNVPAPLGEFFRNDFTYGEKVARIYTEQNTLITLKENHQLIKHKEREGLTFAETSFFEIFNFPLLKGSFSTALTQPNTAIVTESIAQKYFGNQDPIGKSFWLDNKISFVITGVLSDLPRNTDIKSEIFVSYSTLKSYDPWLGDETAGWGGIRSGMSCYTLLQPGVSPEKVGEELQPYVKKYRPNSKNVHHYKLQPLSDIHFNAQYGGAVNKQNLWILSVIGLFLVLTACVNFINLATAQAVKRSKEVGVRKVLGSVKSNLFWQFLSETAIITVIGAAVAVLGAFAIIPYVNDLFNSQIALHLFSDGALLLFILSLILVVTFLAGFYPGLIMAGFQPVVALKGKLSQQTVGGFNTRRTLIISQFAISQVLIIGMVVIMNQMRYARQQDLGFDKEAIVMVPTGEDSIYSNKTSLKNEMARLPGVEKVSLCFTAPASDDDWGNSIRFDNDTEEVNFRTSIKSADADYVTTFDLEIVAGRNLTPSDTVREIMVNEALLRKLNISAEDALGKTIHANGGRMNAPIVGVIADFHDKSFHEDISAVLLTTSSEDYSRYAIKLSGTKNLPFTLKAIEKRWTQQYPDQLFEFEFLDESIARFYREEQTMLNVIQVFSGIAIFIGCLGLYGLVSFMVTHKTKEIGIRKVLGGSVAHILWIFGKEFARLIVIAFLVAAPIGWWLMNNWLQGFKYKMPINAWTFVLAIGCSLVIAALTVGYKVLKTAYVNPVKSLRSE
ncbi:MAG: hypothetical protein DI538_16650 [Azospira oryzae]|jgi:putative ABC transport system permease protein|nr:MAG: hypothetical protein DI538_16650 [Azospira oryzae]